MPPWGVATLPPLGDTIVAIASAPGTGAVGVVRLSGPGAYAVADVVFAPRRGGPPSTRAAGRVVYGTVRAADAYVDEALLLTFRRPRSYTGEDVVEIQTHGGPAVLRATVDACRAAGARAAGPGEFTLRAYLSGRLDLAQAESVMDVVTAQTDAARRNAGYGLSGGLTARLGAIRADLLAAYAAVQAGFDYPDEGVPEHELAAPLARAGADLRALLATADAGRLSRSGARLALLGRPNAGKSSLLNALVGYERSLVSADPGTTRDYLEAPLTLGGIPLVAIDTAGLRTAGDRVEAAGVEVARRIAAQADLRLVLIDGSRPLDGADRRLLAEIGLLADGTTPPAVPKGAPGPGAERTLVVATKSDLAAAWALADLPLPPSAPSAIRVSAESGAGLRELEQRIVAALLGSAAGAEYWVGNERHVTALEAALEAVERAGLQAAAARHDMAALDLQEALQALGAVTGRQELAAETLAEIFARFCVGK